MPTLESLFSAVSPQSTLGGDPSGPDAILDLALAARGMKPDQWHALLWRFLRDDKARAYLDHRLTGIARHSRSNAVRDRAYLLAHLVTSEEHSQLETLYESEAEHILMQCSRREWRDKMRPQFLQLRAQLDRWCRAGASLIRKRLADG